MPDQLAPEPNLREIGEALTRIDQRMRNQGDELSTANRLRNLALLVAALCLVAAGFSVGYAKNSGDDAETARAALAEQTHTNRVVLCNSARSTALAFREPQISATGVAETAPHFVERMLAQRTQLQGVGNLRCSGLPGFATFPYLRGHALHEIEVVLHEAEPRRFAPARPEHVRQARQQHREQTSSQTAVAPHTSHVMPSASPAPSKHATHLPGHSHPEGGSPPHTGSHGPGPKPEAEGPPPVPEPTNPATAPAEAGSPSPAHETSTVERESTTTIERPTNAGAEVVESVGGALESVGGAVESAGEALGGVLGGP